MDTEGLFAVDPDDIPLLAATFAIAVGCVLVIADIGRGHPLVALLVIGGTVAFVGLTFRRVDEMDFTVGTAAVSMIFGAALVGIEVPFAVGFDGPIGAALFLFGAIRLSEYVDE